MNRFRISIAAALLAPCFTGHPLPAFGKAESKSQAPEGKPPENPAPDAKVYVPTGTPLHGDPTQPNTQQLQPRDESILADKAIAVAGNVSGIGGETSEIAALLARAETVQEDTALGIHDLVELRLNLQRFRNQDEATAAKVDEETNRLEAIILGLEAKRAPVKRSITGQSRNK